MSDGGGETGRDGESSSSGKCKSSGGGDDFGRAVSKIAVAQVCESAGFQVAQSSAIEALSDIAVQYICDIGKSAQFYANLAGRTDSNVFDIIQGLEDLNSTRGFPGASDPNHCPVSSGVIGDIRQFIYTQEEIPFARQVPHFPIVRGRNSAPSFVDIEERPPGDHIPNWLPAFPDPHTYINTPVWTERVSDPKEDKIEQAKQRRKAEKSLLNLQKRLAGDDANVSTPIEEPDTVKGKQVMVEGNPFLAPALPFGEREVSPPLLFDDTAKEKKMSVLETFGPVIAAMKSNDLDPGTNEQSILPSNRPSVRFNISIGKKTLASPVPLTPAKQKNASWPLGNEERDDKKRKAEMILRESMMNPNELHKL